MSVPDSARAVAREWVLKAESDLKAAAFLLTMKGDCPTEVVCFHAQQCVEKYMKALLVLASVDFPKTHDLQRLARLRASTDLGLSKSDLAELTDHAVAARYPGSGEIPISDAKRAVALARRARKAARQALPMAVKRTPAK